MAELVHIKSGEVEASIDPMGAQLMSLALGGAEYLWQGDPAHWSRRAPVLFPIVGCLRHDHAVSAQGEVSLKRHGIARLYEHRVVTQDDASVTFELRSSAETHAAFPYDFCLNMTYAVADGKLSQTYRVTNTGSVDLPFTLGGHPAFNVPVPGATDGEAEGFSDYELRFAEPWSAQVPLIDADGLHDFSRMTTLFEDADHLPLSHELIDRLLTLVFCDVPGHTVTLLSTCSGHGVQVDFDGFDYLGVWTSDTTAPFVAIEPWCGCATAYDESDVFEEKRGIITLAPGESCERTFTMRPF